MLANRDDDDVNVKLLYTHPHIISVMHKYIPVLAIHTQ